MSPILNTEIKDALVHVFKQLGGVENGGKLTLEQFSQVCTYICTYTYLKSVLILTGTQPLWVWR